MINNGFPGGDTCLADYLKTFSFVYQIQFFPVIFLKIHVNNEMDHSFPQIHRKISLISRKHKYKQR